MIVQATFLDTYPNAPMDMSATVQDLGRAPRLWRDFLVKYTACPTGGPGRTHVG